MSDTSTAAGVLEKYLHVVQHQIQAWSEDPQQSIDLSLIAAFAPDLPLGERYIKLLCYLYETFEKRWNGTESVVEDSEKTQVVDILSEAILVAQVLLTLTYDEQSQELVRLYTVNTLPTQMHPVLVELGLFHKLAMFYYMRYYYAEDADDLNTAISITRVCINIDDGDGGADDNAYLCKLLCAKFRKTPDFETINEAIDHGRASLRGIYQESPQHRWTLARALRDRYMYYHTEDDLHDAIDILRRAIVNAPVAAESLSATGSPWLLLLNELGAILMDGVRSGHQPMEIADEAIGILRKVVAHTLPNHDEYRLRLYTLSAALYSRSDKLFDLNQDVKVVAAVDDEGNDDINEAIVILEWLLERKDQLYPRLQMLVVTLLGQSLYLRYDKSSRSIEDLDQMVEITRRALDKYTDSNLREVGYMTETMGWSYWQRFQIEGDPNDLEVSMEYFGKLERADISMLSALLNLVTYHHDAAMIAYRKALNVLPQSHLRGRHYRNPAPYERRFDTLGSSAIAAMACVTFGHYNEALELLELGRTMGWTRGLQMRTELNQLEVDHPQYAERFKELSQSLEKAKLAQLMPGSSDGALKDPWPASEPSWEQPFKLSQRWDALLAEIRSLERYEDFLTTPNYDQLKRVSDKGPVVVINVSPYRSSAFILAQSTLDRPQIVPLHRTLHKLVEDWSDKLLDGLKKVEDGSMLERNFSVSILRPILVDLWSEIVLPIRESLSCMSPYARRIWWCPIGRLTALPLHLVTNGLDAIGLGRDNDGPRTSSPILTLFPSYTITLSSLLRARSSLEDRRPVSLLAVSCENARELNSEALPGTSKEVKMLQKSARVAGLDMTVLKDLDATVDQVLSEMSNRTWLHLACHGLQSFEEPYQSQFLLSDGSLRMADLVSTKLDHAQFAFLSACQTAQGVPTLSDEAMHLAAGLQFAGFCGTIATMWSIHDQTTTKLAKEVYAFLLRDTNPEPNVEDAAEGLWMAIESLRKTGVPISRLAPFIHMGV